MTNRLRAYTSSRRSLNLLKGEALSRRTSICFSTFAVIFLISSQILAPLDWIVSVHVFICVRRFAELSLRAFWTLLRELSSRRRRLSIVVEELSAV